MAGRVDPLMNSQGQVTQAVFIFTSMLRKLLADEKPHYIAAVFESGEKTFRHETFEGYKAHRAEMPDDLSSFRRRSWRRTSAPGSPGTAARDR